MNYVNFKIRTIFFYTLGVFFIGSFALAQTSSDVSVSAQVEQVLQPYQINQGGVVPPFFIERQFQTEIEALKKATLIFSGKTSPGAAVSIKLSQANAELFTFSDSKGDFYVKRQTLLNNYYDVSVQATDVFGNKSGVFTFAFNIIPGENKKENIFLSPTTMLDKSEITKGETVNIKGATYPLSSVIINISSFDGLNSRQFFSTSDALGLWNADIETSGFLSGTYFISAFSQTDKGLISEKSENFVLRILQKPDLIQSKIPTIEPPISFQALDIGSSALEIKQADLSKDKKVGLKDLSIMLSNWGKNFKNPSADLNNDKKVDLKDLSILMFYWTR